MDIKTKVVRKEFLEKLALGLKGEYKTFYCNGYGSYKLQFDTDWIEVKLTEKTMLEIKVSQALVIGIQWADNYNFYGDFENYQYYNHYDLIWETKVMQTIVNVFQEFMDELNSRASSLLYNMENEEYIEFDWCEFDSYYFDTIIEEVKDYMIKKYN